MGKRDEDLIMEYQLGSMTAAEELFEKYKQLMFNFALRILTNRADAEDVVGEIFLVLFSGKYTPNPKAKFSTWLYTVARNACISKVRTKKKWYSFWMKKDKETNEYEQIDIADYESIPDQVAQENEQAHQVQLAIKKLPREYREMIILREYQKLSYLEIAQVMDMTLEKVKVSIFRARERLKKELMPFMKEASDDE